jgi:hypothetical protein
VQADDAETVTGFHPRAETPSAMEGLHTDCDGAPVEVSGPGAVGDDEWAKIMGLPTPGRKRCSKRARLVGVRTAGIFR